MCVAVNDRIPDVETLNGPRRKKTCLQGFANNTGADQLAHPLSLITACVIIFLNVSYVNLLQIKFQFSS